MLSFLRVPHFRPNRPSSLVPALFSLFAGTAAAFGGAEIASGDAPGAAVDKWQYNLFNPTPREHMREMKTDRPDTTESAYSVDAGHYQIEMSFFDYGRNRANGERTETWAFGLMNLKVGLLNNMDFQVVFDSYTEERTRFQGTTDRVSGFSDVTLRLKTNLWGNDGGKTALALMPFVKIPTDTELSNNQWEGGVILPFAMSLTDKIDFACMIEADFVHDEERGGYDVEWVHTATVGFELTEHFGMFVEYTGVAGSDDEFDYQATFDAGVTFTATDNLIFDAGVRVGLNEAADDLGLFMGMSVRF